jgi:hypothetical protein
VNTTYGELFSESIEEEGEKGEGFSFRPAEGFSSDAELVWAEAE